MRKLAVLMLLIFLLAVGIASASQTSSPQSDGGKSDGTTTQRKSPQTAAVESNPATNAPAKSHSDSADLIDPERQIANDTHELAKATDRLAFATVVLVLISAFQIFFLVKADRTNARAANAAKDSVDQMRVNATHELRAYLAIEDVAYVIEKGVGEIRFWVRNVGKTPAKNVLTHAVAFMETFPMTKPITRLDFSIDPSPRAVIHPGSNTPTYERTGLPIDIFTTSQYTDDPKIMYFQIEVRYTDIFCTVDEFRFTSVMYNSGNADGLAANKFVAYRSGHDYS